jgi:hypothetical protein
LVLWVIFLFALLMVPVVRFVAGIILLYVFWLWAPAYVWFVLAKLSR